MRPDGPAPMMSLQNEYECWEDWAVMTTNTSVRDSEALLSSMMAVAPVACAVKIHK